MNFTVVTDENGWKSYTIDGGTVTREEWERERLRLIVENAQQGNHTAARLLEDEIERRDRWAKYVSALLEQTDIPSPTWEPWAIEDVWNLIRRATPEQRARAFLHVVEEG